MAEAILDYNSRIMSGAYVSGLEVEGVAKGGWGERTINITDLISGEDLRGISTVFNRLGHWITSSIHNYLTSNSKENKEYMINQKILYDNGYRSYHDVFANRSYASGGGSVYRYSIFQK
jgi:hypothetical protein